MSLRDAKGRTHSSRRAPPETATSPAAPQRYLVVFGLAFLPLLASEEPIQTRPDDGWLGKRVVQKTHDLTLRVNDEPLESDGNALRFYLVEQVDGPSLLLKALGQGKSGWANVSQVIPVDQAINFFAQQVKDHPQDAFSFAMLALLRHDKHELDLAIANYDVAIRLDPRNASTLSSRGTAWHAKKEYDRAIADFDLALRLDPKHSLAFIGRGITRAARKQYTQAIADQSEAIWLDPLSIAAYYNRGLAWQSKKEYGKAIVDYNLAIRIDSQQAAVYRQRGASWEAQQSYSKAIADYNEAIRIDSGDIEAYRARAWLLATCPDLGLRDAKVAVDSARKAFELTKWKDAAAIDALAAVCAATGDFESAVSWQTKANTLARGAVEKIEGAARLKRYREKRQYP
jgi:tetratricopeptide (TPR) repeat protein